jgi:hypothetical protein
MEAVGSEKAGVPKYTILFFCKETHKNVVAKLTTEQGREQCHS